MFLGFLLNSLSYFSNNFSNNLDLLGSGCFLLGLLHFGNNLSDNLLSCRFFVLDLL